MERRHFLLASAAGLTAPSLFLPGCAARAEDLRRVVQPGQKDLPLVVDVHAHIFNGSDLQVSEFIQQVAVNEDNSTALKWLAQVFGPVLESLGNNFAPSAERELRILKRLDLKRSERSVVALRKMQYDDAKTKIEAAARDAMAKAGLTEAQLWHQVDRLQPHSIGFASALDLPDTYEDLFDDEQRTQLAALNVRAGLRFLVEMFQFRHVSAVNYFDTYRAANAGVDLVTPSLVDYDWWLASGKSTHSKLPQQVALAERIAIASGGAIHPFVPFDPFRQAICTELGIGEFSPIDLVKRAIHEQGAVGVKLYPPMGFAIYGNKQFPTSIWSTKTRLHEFARRDGFPMKLDAALDQLYSFCAREGVAVMAHSSRSNMAHKDYDDLLLAESWSQLLETQYDGRYVATSFGHFSGFGSEAPEDHWRKFVDLLKQDTNPAHRFADLSYFTETISKADDLTARLRTVLYDANGAPTSVPNQLLYGSDWKMLLMEENAKQYLRSTMSVLKDADVAFRALGLEVALTQRVLGGNALTYLGLHRGGQARKRLESFYERNSVDEPLWMKKADRLLA